MTSSSLLAGASLALLCGCSLLVDDGTGPVQEMPFEPSNVSPEIIGDGTAPWIVEVPAVFDTDTGQLEDLLGEPIPLPEGVTYQRVDTPHPIQLAVVSASEIEVATGVSLYIVGSRALILTSAGDVRLNGVIAAPGGPVGALGLVAVDRAGPGGFAGGIADGIAAGGGVGGGMPGVASNENDDSGGAGAGHAGPGGAGGREADDVPVPGGNVAGEPALVPLIGGSGGGSGSTEDGGNGGGGGGAIQISAAGTIVVGAHGGIHVAGAGGGEGQNDESGGGGGAGGAALLEAQQIDLLTGSILAANGGGGGSGASTVDGTAGFGGDAGGFGDQPARGGASSTTGSGPGGDGSPGAEAAGTDGALQELGAANGGGGGGAGGRIRLRSRELGERRGTISPSGPDSLTDQIE